jgi:hypothetical protein
MGRRASLRQSAGRSSVAFFITFFKKAVSPLLKCTLLREEMEKN